MMDFSKQTMIFILSSQGCQSSWTRELETKTEAGKMEMTETADTLERQMSRGSVFGGDLDPILNLISATLTRIKAETDNDALASDDRDDQVQDIQDLLLSLKKTRRQFFSKTVKSEKWSVFRYSKELKDIKIVTLLCVSFFCLKSRLSI